MESIAAEVSSTIPMASFTMKESSTKGSFPKKAGSLHRVESCSTKDIFIRVYTMMKGFSLPVMVRYFMPENSIMVNR